jgi:ribosomal protein S18 acetylase RimI-like enzyme
VLTADAEPCVLLPWDSEFWGKRIGRVRGDRLAPVPVDTWAREHSVACLYFLARDDPGAASAAEDGGFRLVDVRVELDRPAAGDEASTLRPAVPEDEAALRSVARSNHRITRFYADPRFPDERCDELYETWIARSLEGWADAVLVAGEPGAPDGYVSCHALAEGSAGSIGLIGVAPEARGRGVGRELVAGAVAWCRDRGLERVTVVTQGRNVPALRTFESCGFRTADVALWFHKWYEA